MTIFHEPLLVTCATCQRQFDFLDPRAKHDLTHCSRHKVTHDRDRCSRCQRIAAFWGEGATVPPQGEAAAGGHPARSEGMPQQMVMPL